MLVGSVDIQGRHAVQLVGGEDMAVDGGDPAAWVDRFARVYDVAVIDLDAAMGTGSNADVIRPLLKRARCRVGGGIRTVEAALAWLDAGAEKVILGTAARPEILSQLPAERVIAAVDARHGEVVVEGWKKGTGARLEDRIRELRDHVGGFLVTLVESEGRLGGIDMARVRQIVEMCGSARVTVAGGVTTAEEVAEIDALGADCQVGMALYTGRLHEADALAAILKSDRDDGLWPTVVTDVHGVALGLAYSNAESLRVALERGVGAYHSRKRGLWIKGETSGAVQRLVRVDLDCDRDTLRFVVDQGSPGFCHEETWTCWGPAAGIPALSRTIAQRGGDAPAGSYTRRLFDDPALLASKLVEEARELAEAREPADVAHEVGDVLYFALVAAARAGVSLADVDAVLDARSRRVTRRPGNAKPPIATPPSVQGPDPKTPRGQ